MDIQTTYSWLQLYESSKISTQDLARELHISKRQMYRIIKRYKKEGIKDLLHKGINKPSNHHIEEAKKDKILRLIKEKYYNCSASYASELMQENKGIEVNKETLRYG